MNDITISPKRVLLVDDEREVREAVRRMLAQDRHVVVEANNGAEALSLFVRNQFDLVITDLELPFLKGDELAVRIRQLVPQQPIMAITAYYVRSGPNSPFDLVLSKPFDANRLRNGIASLLPEPEEAVAA